MFPGCFAGLLSHTNAVCCYVNLIWCQHQRQIINYISAWICSFLYYHKVPSNDNCHSWVVRPTGIDQSINSLINKWIPLQFLSSPLDSGTRYSALKRDCFGAFLLASQPITVSCLLINFSSDSVASVTIKRQNEQLTNDIHKCKLQNVPEVHAVTVCGWNWFMFLGVITLAVIQPSIHLFIHPSPAQMSFIPSSLPPSCVCLRPCMLGDVVPTGLCWVCRGKILLLSHSEAL